MENRLSPVPRPLSEMRSPLPGDVADLEDYIARLVSGRAEPDRSNLEGYLRLHPGHTLRDWKGKGPTLPPETDPKEKPWRSLSREEVRAAAVATSARDLPRNVRQAAARDNGLVWNPLARKYRLRRHDDPPRDDLTTGAVS